MSSDELLEVPLSSTPLLCIRYPGFVRNIERALDTMGGLETMEHAYNQHIPMLELRYQPSNTSLCPMRATRENANGILLKVVRRKKSGTMEAAVDTSEQSLESVEALGVVRSEFKFTGKSIQSKMDAGGQRGVYMYVFRQSHMFDDRPGISAKEMTVRRNGRGLG